MRVLFLILFLILLIPAVALQAQELNLEPALQAISSKASKTTEVDLDSMMLALASKFLSDRDPEEAAAKRLIEGLKSIRVRVLEFDGEGQYSASDLEPLRAQIDCSRNRNCPWRRFFRVQGSVKRRAASEDVEVWMNGTGDVTNGLLLISSEPREVVVVSIVGPIKPEDLALIGGHFGIPRIQVKEE